jgi:nitrogen fixation protein FixH
MWRENKGKTKEHIQEVTVSTAQPITEELEQIVSITPLLRGEEIFENTTQLHHGQKVCPFRHQVQ